MNQSLEWCRGARAYIKAALPVDSGATLALVRDESSVLRDLQNGLLVAYVVDEGGRFTYVQHRHLSSDETNGDALHLVALNTLHEFAGGKVRLQPHGSLFAVFLDGNCEASTLLLDALWDHALSQYVRGDFVAALPARDVLAFGDAASPDAVKELRALADRVHRRGADHLQTRSLYRRRARQSVIHEA